MHQLLLGKQPLIQLINSLEAPLDRRDHLLFQQGDLLLAIGLVDSGAAQRQPPTQLQDPLDFLSLESSSRKVSSSGLQNAPFGAIWQNGEAASESMAMTIGAESGAESGAATGTIPVGALSQEGPKMERPIRHHEPDCPENSFGQGDPHRPRDAAAGSGIHLPGRVSGGAHWYQAKQSQPLELGPGQEPASGRRARSPS